MFGPVDDDATVAVDVTSPPGKRGGHLDGDLRASTARGERAADFNRWISGGEKRADEEQEDLRDGAVHRTRGRGFFK